jgi:hypothetical protein
MYARAVVCLILGLLADTGSSERLSLPYYDWDACPFEGCTYRAWKAVRPTTAWTDRDYQSPIALSIKAGEWVTGITGVVVTYQPGLSRVLEPMSLGHDPSVRVVPGDLLLTLHYLGEGYDLFWFKGKLYSDQIASDEPDPDPPPPALTIQVISRPVAVWWVKVKAEDGKIGWTDQTRNFENMDQFAEARSLFRCYADYRT